MPTPLKKAFIKFLLFLLALMKVLGRAILAFFQLLLIPFVFLWKAVLRRLAFLVYTLLLRAKISTGRVLSPARRTFFAIFGHRYVVHAIVAVMILFTASTNLYARGEELDEESTQALIYDLLKLPQDFTLAESLDPAAESQLNASPEGVAEKDGGTDDLGPLTYDTGVVAPIILPGAAGEEPKPMISKVEEYVVQSGDTISGIAQKYGVSINTLLWANGMTARSLIRPGQSLKVLPVTGVLHKVKKGETIGTIAKKYGADLDRILQANRVASASQIQIGEELIIPDGKPPVTAAPRVQSAPSRLGDVRDVFRPPTEAPPSRAADGVELVWPTDLKRINQYYKWRHPGLDINGRLDNAVYAADAGIVTFSGWNRSGYGNMILIDHGNGMVTRYAHHSKHFVKAGDQVAKGQTIAMIGSTGRSTGPHLHFELYVNGKRVNPLEYYR
jgi:murein DD-endopeptidase MepM/ murein hydrolase activator NlpD